MIDKDVPEPIRAVILSEAKDLAVSHESIIGKAYQSSGSRARFFGSLRDPQNDIKKALGRVASLWLSPTHPLRCEAVAALQVSTGFKPEMIEAALEAAFEELTEEKIHQFCASEGAFAEDSSVKKVLHILAGNVFTAWLPGAVISLLLDADCWLKPSTHEPVFAPLWKRSLEDIDPALAKKVSIVVWQDDLLKRCDAVVAYGSNETLENLRRQTPGTIRFIGYGHKISVAVIFKEALSENSFNSLLENLVRDVEPFNLQGCLSPQTVYVEGDVAPLIDGLRTRAAVMPRFKRIERWEECVRELMPLKDQLSALGYAGPEARIQALRSQIDELGFSRVCRLGEMQRPPLTWRNGGFSLAQKLVS